MLKVTVKDPKPHLMSIKNVPVGKCFMIHNGEQQSVYLRTQREAYVNLSECSVSSVKDAREDDCAYIVSAELVVG